MRDEWEKPLPEQGCIRMVEGVLGIEIQTEIQDNTGGGNTREKTLYFFSNVRGIEIKTEIKDYTGGGNTREKTLYLYVLCWEEKYRRKY